AAIGLKARERPFLVRAHQPAIAGDVRRENGCEPALDRIRRHWADFALPKLTSADHRRFSQWLNRLCSAPRGRSVGRIKQRLKSQRTQSGCGKLLDGDAALIDEHYIVVTKYKIGMLVLYSLGGPPKEMHNEIDAWSQSPAGRGCRASPRPHRRHPRPYLTDRI